MYNDRDLKRRRELEARSEELRRGRQGREFSPSQYHDDQESLNIDIELRQLGGASPPPPRHWTELRPF
ncbi:MAG: hypothetical protein A2312_03755 [Candidatus Staskawiczbacteria bacterium RIFOXYB2_FULL_32_9]|nr:MAG: hypothetical protein UR22_C0002G0039 [Parcubacteria group bacterium GW2011_GWC2_32_10]OGZ80211.1 MAG: hypothetical protein A2256_00235 [Candidatus Staskawiczbacteria bacterium RIFOXYA2_FULL_32_7]OGZ80763.1 MAG: hypothetical protein A2360_02560 [Candidatus Staskawiczbacteria bacterium RIFOXYB1_FULL_32_11]OGZ82299.1 MAG: hypothetical protein A2312_03755 [Candidatus Staskawiczbacteria bacterium RIFOXYB2_FULL_32_9]